MAAKRSRDARRLKENQIAMRAGFLEKEVSLKNLYFFEKKINENFFLIFCFVFAEFGFTAGNGKIKTRKYGSSRQIVEIYRCLKNFVNLFWRLSW